MPARKLAEHDDLPAALGTREQRLRPFVTRHQKEALRGQHFFMPANTFGHVARRGVVRVTGTPVGARLTKVLMN